MRFMYINGDVNKLEYAVLEILTGSIEIVFLSLERNGNA